MGRIGDGLRRFKRSDNTVCEEDPDDAQIVTVRFDGQTYQIPVDSTGRVPRWALAMRFQQAGSVDDIDTREGIVLPAECTPQELIRWWADPSSCDIAGIDTPDSQIYDMTGVPSRYVGVQRRIAVVDADPKEQMMIRRVLMDCFDREELEAMASNGSFIIRSMANMGGATGCYYRKQDGVEIPIVMLEKGNSEDQMVHEMTHHLRATDRKRHGLLRAAFPTRRDGSLDSEAWDSLSKEEQDSIVEREERMTVAETAVRAGTDRSQSGYYDRIRGITDPHEAYVQDRRIITDSEPQIPQAEIPRLKGKKARDATLQGYAYSNIARAEILSNDVSKR